MIDEGYTKFDLSWTRADPLACQQVDELNRWRKPLFAAGLIGHYEDSGIGFGNISVRANEPGHFIISGTQTGHLEELTSEHYALVTDYDIDRNHVSCSGPVQASSESMTHATIYALDAAVGAIAHVHSDTLWVRLMHTLPTTDAAVRYGTPDMAMEFERLYRESTFAITGIAVMAGHESGLISIGKTMEQAAHRILDA